MTTIKQQIEYARLCTNNSEMDQQDLKDCFRTILDVTERLLHRIQDLEDLRDGITNE